MFGARDDYGTINAVRRTELRRMKDNEDPVNHPSHYGGDTTYEVIKVLEAWGLDADFYLGNAIKYIARCASKDVQIVNLKKAAFYLNRRITLLEKNADAANHT